MIGCQLIPWYTPHTQNIQTAFFFCLLQLFATTRGKKKVCLTIQSVIDPQHTVIPPINILSAHAHGKRLSGASQKVRNQWRGESRVTQTPCTVGAMPLLT